MKFENIPTVLSKYTFRNKMFICQNISREIMTINGILGVNELRDKIMPWEIETFALFSILPETVEHSTEEITEQVFLEIMDSIRNYEHPILVKAAANNEFADYFLIVTGLTQFPLQENIYFKYFRYDYFFNFVNKTIDMKKEFYIKFKMNFDRVRRFALFFNLIFNYRLEDGTIPDATKILNYFSTDYFDVVKLFTLDRTELLKFQFKIINETEQYMYGFRYFYQYPFIEEKKLIYMPLPHLINMATTSSLLFRLTENNNTLRDKFGKEVLENYLVEVCSINKECIEIVPEYVYDKKRNMRTIDIMLNFEDHAILMDSKSFSPKVALRDLSDDEIDYSTKIIVKSVKQMYLHIKERFNVTYFPFGKGKQFELNNTFGIVVIAEDNFVRRERIMRKAAEELKIDVKSDEFDFLCSNIKVLSLYNIEDIFFYNRDIIKLLKNNQGNRNKWFNYTLINEIDDTPKLDMKILECEKKVKDIYMDIIREMKDKNLISK